MDELDTKARLGRVVQAALGDKLRAQYDMGQNLPIDFVHLLRRFENEGTSLPSYGSPAAAAKQATLAGSFDPETIAKLEKALDDGWATLSHIGNRTITRERLAGRIFEIAEAGERDSARLATQAVTSLIMEGDSL